MIYDGTGSVEVCTGWHLVVLGQYGAVLGATMSVWGIILLLPGGTGSVCDGTWWNWGNMGQ